MSLATKSLEANCSPVIVKFLYFDHENLVNGNRTFLANLENIHPHNFQPIFWENAFQDTFIKLEEE